MSAIQSGASWWVDGFARYPGSQVGRDYRTGAMGNSSSVGQNPDVWGTDESDSFASVVSDVEEEGEVETTHEETETESTAESVSTGIESGDIDSEASAAIVAATAANIGVIEAAMRQHQTTGIADFKDDNSEDNQDPTDEAFEDALTGDMLQDPALTFAAAGFPEQDRAGILWLLK